LELPAKLDALVHSELEQLEIEFGQMTDAFADAFRKGDCRREFPTVRGALEGLRQRADQIRRERILASESLDAPIQLLEVISRCQGIGDKLEECARQSGQRDSRAASPRHEFAFADSSNGIFLSVKSVANPQKSHKGRSDELIAG
jgi:hypothetical protein